MTNEELDRLEALAKAATPGPWYHVYEGSSDWQVYGPHDDIKPVASLHRYHAPSCPDAPFIAAARDAVPALVAEVKRLRGALVVVAEYEACIGDDYDQPIQNHARKALEGA